MNFYDSRNEFDYAAKTYGYDFDALKTALNVGDCTKIDNSYDGSNYTSCAHVVLEGKMSCLWTNTWRQKFS